MSQQKKRACTFIPVTAYPPKRRPGRPRKEQRPGRPLKEEHLGQNLNGQSPPQHPPSQGLKSSPQYFAKDPSDDHIENELVGQVVTGIIEGSFDAGYVISVRATKTGTFLRGVVFQTGLFTPVTAENDIAPHVWMYKRRDFPIPADHPQPEQNNNHFTSNMAKLSHTFAEVPTSTDSLRNKNKDMLQQKSDFSHQFRSITIPPTSNLRGDSSGASTGGRNMIFPLPRFSMWGNETSQLKNSKSALDNKPASQSKSDTTFPLLRTDMLRGNNLSRQNSDSGLQKQSSTKSQLSTQFPPPRKFATVTLPLTKSLSKENVSVSTEGKEIPQKNLKLSLDNKTIHQLKSGMPFASDKVPMTYNLPMNNLASSSIEKENPNRNSKFFALAKPDIEFALGKQSASVFVLPTEKFKEGTKTGQQNYGFGLGDVSTPRLGSNGLPIQNSIEGKKTVQQNYGFGLGDKNRITKQNGIVVASELTLGIFPENPTSSTNDAPHELSWSDFHGNRKPVTDAADNTLGASQSVPKPKELPVNMMEGITSYSGLKKTEGSFQLFP